MQTERRATVAVRNVSKTYSSKKGSSLFTQRSQKIRPVEALQDVNFVAFSGECIGVVGRNGSGKSTLLRIIAGSESPTKGDIYVSSRPTILGVSAALQQHLSGRENARLGLLAMGVKPSEVEKMVPEVLLWAEVEDAADRALATYSSGMRSRLKFAIATAVKRDILIVDEALSTGDSTFTHKAGLRMDNFLRSAGTVFIVSHSISMIEQRCNRAIWLHDGHVIADGDPGRVSKFYKSWSRLLASDDTEGADRIIRKRRDDYSSNPFLLASEAAEF